MRDEAFSPAASYIEVAVRSTIIAITLVMVVAIFQSAFAGPFDNPMPGSSPDGEGVRRAHMHDLSTENVLWSWYHTLGYGVENKIASISGDNSSSIRKIRTTRGRVFTVRRRENGIPQITPDDGNYD